MCSGNEPHAARGAHHLPWVHLDTAAERLPGAAGPWGERGPGGEAEAGYSIL